MDYRKLDKRVKKIKKVLKIINKSSVSSLIIEYFQNKGEIATICPDYDYDFLCRQHLFVYKQMKKIQSLQLTENELIENRDVINGLLRIKIKLDRLIINNPSYNKAKFKKEFKKEISIHKDANNCLKYNRKKGYASKKVFLERLAEKLYKEECIEESQIDNFKRLFRKLKKFDLNDKIVWKKELVELRGLYDAMDETGIVIRPKNSDAFIENHFVDIYKETITANSFAKKTVIDSHQDYVNIWTDILNKIAEHSE